MQQLGELVVSVTGNQVVQGVLGGEIAWRLRYQVQLKKLPN